MNTRAIVIGVIIVVLAGGAYVAVGRNAAEPLPYYDSSQPTPTYNPNPTSQENNRYVMYTPEAFAAAANMKRILFFFAPWCPTCVPLDKKISANPGQIPSDVILFRVNYDDEKDLKAQYGITYQHTFVFVDAQGNEITKWNGGGLEEIVANTR
jgi:thiol-disulfide isomerase/thioredoxin